MCLFVLIIIFSKTLSNNFLVTDELYNGALFHLDMEDQENVTTKLNLPWKYTLQVTSEENCSDIIQHLGELIAINKIQ